MGRSALKKEKWTLSFDARLKSLVVSTARKRGVYPVSLLEEIVRDRFNPFGHTDVKDSAAYVAGLRRASSRRRSDEEFLGEIRAWQKSRSS